MNRTGTIVVMLLALGATACSTTPCGKPGAYLESSPREPIVIPDGLEKPPVNRRVTIPPVPQRVHPDLRGNMIVQEDGTTRCLVAPPPMRELEPIAR